MDNHDWIKGFPGAITVCDVDGTILAMNDKSVEVFAGDGGIRLMGKNVLDCHPEPARSKLKGMMEAGRTNVYTIKKNGRKKLIFQAPWHREGTYAGFVELSLEIPWTMPHFDRDKA
jgi:hypothetical protein